MQEKELTLLHRFDRYSASQVKYENELEEYKQYVVLEYKKQEEYWKKLNGYQFEREIANLFRQMGHSVQETKLSGDCGIDMVVDGKTIVQCKNHSKPISRPDFQRLYGEFVHNEGKYERVIMVCPSGASGDAKRWIEGKPITIMSLRQIIDTVNMVERQPSPIGGEAGGDDSDTSFLSGHSKE